MYINVNIDGSTTPSQLRALSVFALALAASDLQPVAVAPIVTLAKGLAPVDSVQPETDAAPKRSRTKPKAEALGEPPAETEAPAEPPADDGPYEPVVPKDTIAQDTIKGKQYAESDVQKLAGFVARTKGPEIVKAKISELGASRIAELTPEQLNDLGSYLEDLQ